MLLRLCGIVKYYNYLLDYYKRFYLLFPDIQIVNTCVHNLSWSHIRRILSVSDPNARLWYLKTADKDMWSFRALDRNISTQYYERRLAAQREKSALPVDVPLPHNAT